MAIEIRGTFRFEKDKAWFVFTEHGGGAVEFSAIKSMGHFKEAIEAMRQTAIKLEVGGDAPATGQSSVAIPEAIEDQLREVEQRVALRMKSAEEDFRQRGDELQQRYEELERDLAARTVSAPAAGDD